MIFGRARNVSQTAGKPDRYLDSAQPENYPGTECINKNVVFVHGYDVNGDQAQGWHSEVFKRMYWSGNRAKFYGVSWSGDRAQHSVTGLVVNSAAKAVQKDFA